MSDDERDADRREDDHDAESTDGEQPDADRADDRDDDRDDEDDGDQGDEGDHDADQEGEDDQDDASDDADERDGSRADGAPADPEERRAAAERAAERAQSEEGPDDRTVLDGHQVEAELLADWRVMMYALHARFRTGDFATGARLVDGIAAAADEADHHPDVDLRYGHVDVRLSSHDVGGVTMRDVRLARTVSDLAEGLRARPDTGVLSVVELALDTPDRDEIKPFWAALLGLDSSEDDEDELTDPDGRLSTVWFQESEDREEPGQRWHLDVRVPPEEADRRIKAALDAGGTMVSDARAPAFWVLADAQGNRACITTWLGRS